MKTKIELKTKVKDNHGHTYSVCLQRYKSFDKESGLDGDWVLNIEDAPGGWFMHTLLIETDGKFKRDLNSVQGISLDHGQDWNLLDINEALREALIKLTLSEKSQ